MEEQGAGMEEQDCSSRHAGMEKQDARIQQHECRVGVVEHWDGVAELEELVGGMDK